MAMDSEEEAQHLRSEMRLEFLKCMEYLADRKFDITLFSGFQSEGTLKATDREIWQFFIEDLKTPTGIVSNSILRTHDIDSMTTK